MHAEGGGTLLYIFFVLFAMKIMTSFVRSPFHLQIFTGEGMHTICHLQRLHAIKKFDRICLVSDDKIAGIEALFAAAL